ncbi:HAD family hydrolase [Geothrix terrae]|uniref:HAD family hydrolase n=1 Tax=Geothrix terrae TaxID=2922720 RepID=UPI001FAC89A9|nr:HAD family phosphatase [Geothrix terrae]
MTLAPPAPPAIRAVIFDFGQVVCTFDNRRMYRALSDLCGLPEQDLARRVAQSDLPRAYETGKISSPAFLEGLSALCGFAFPEAAFVRAFTDIFVPIPSTFDLIRRLRPRYRLGLLSNTSPWHAEHGIRTTGVFPLFDAVTFSYEVGAMKPDPRIYRDMLAKLRLPPEACAFIDDLPENVEGARAIGMHGITYPGPTALLTALRALGVEP